MKKISILGLVIVLMISLCSCKSIEQMVNDGEYEKAYNIAKTNDDKLKVIDLMVKTNKNAEAMQLLDKNYFGEKEEEYLLKKFIDLIKVKKYVSAEYGKIALDAYKRIGYNDYNKKWTALNLIKKSTIAGYIESTFDDFFKALIRQKGFVGLETQSDNESYKRYDWVRKIKPKIDHLISTEFQARTRAETEQKQKNAINSITDVLVKYGQSRYQDDWDCGKQGEYYNDDDIGVVAVKIGNTIYVFDYLGIVDKWTYNLPKGYNFMHQMNMYNADRNTYDMMRGMNKTYGNMLGLEALSKDTYAYFENITNDVFIKELLGSLKK